MAFIEIFIPIIILFGFCLDTEIGNSPLMYFVKSLGKLIIILFLSFILINGIEKRTSNEPTAIDVYRGLTDLEIHSINNTPIDTVVIFKQNKYGK